MKPTLVFATHNEHKLTEIRQILGDSYNIRSLTEIGCHDDIPETGETLEENALIKARYVKEHYGYDCFSDDTGLFVDALDGRPGVYSARYAGDHCSPADNIAKMLSELADVPTERRTAHFTTVVALIQNGEEHLFRGHVHGRILQSQRGATGFGYDPIFLPDEQPTLSDSASTADGDPTGLSFAQMTAEQKNKISHRGRAVAALAHFLNGQK